MPAAKNVAKPPRNLIQMLDRLEENARERDRVTIDSMMDAVGRRSFGPVILIVGLIAMSPLSGIPTLPSILGVMVVLVAGQLLLGKDHFWLPGKVLRRSISQEKFLRGIEFIRPASRWVDRCVSPRLTFLTKGPGAHAVAFFCVLIGLTMPPLEILPFMATTAGVALTVFGLSLVANDGLLALLAFLVTGGMAVFVAMQLLT